MLGWNILIIEVRIIWTCSFLLHLFECSNYEQQNKVYVYANTLKRDTEQGLHYANFVKDEFSYLNVTPTASKHVSKKSECAMATVKMFGIYSFNLAARTDSSGRLKCELLSTDKYNDTQKFVFRDDFHHFSIYSPACATSPCQNDGACIPLYEIATYFCKCFFGWKGKNCTDHECHRCDNNAICNNTNGSYVCQCKVGFTGDGLNCTDVDECANNSHNCDPSATCVNTQGSHKCTCKRGFHINEASCVENTDLNSSRILTDYGNSSYLNTLNDFLAPVLQNPSTQWMKCWRAGRDGWAGSTFHSLCDNKGPTVTIVRVDNYVFGGYADVSFGRSGYVTSSRSFLYSLYNTKGYYPMKLSLTGSNEEKYAIHGHPSYGPTFGRGHDIYIANDASTNNVSATVPLSYQPPPGCTRAVPCSFLAGSYPFIASDVEVFYETTT